MGDLLKLILSEKGRDGNRALILVLVGLTFWRVGEVEKRVAVIEARLASVGQAVTNSAAGLARLP